MGFCDMSLQGTLFSINEINGLTDSISCFVKDWAELTQRAVRCSAPYA